MEDNTIFAASEFNPGFNMIFANGWEISVQWGRDHYCANKDNQNKKSCRSRTAEVAIFAPDKDGFPRDWWSYDEDINEVVEQPQKTCVNGHLTTDQVANIIAIISKKSA
jgi:hypothetical protein